MVAERRFFRSVIVAAIRCLTRCCRSLMSAAAVCMFGGLEQAQLVSKQNMTVGEIDSVFLAAL